LKPFIIKDNKILRLRVSGLAQAVYCGKRAKISLFYKPEIKSRKEYKAISIGKKLHKIYEGMMRNLSFDRILVKYKLRWAFRIFERQVRDTNILIVGKPDDLRVLMIKENGEIKKYTMLIEVKTTNRRVWKKEILMAIKQLQLYMWLLKEELDKIGFPLWKYGLVEYYSQKTGDLLKRISVEYDDNIEEWIKYVVNSFKGEQYINVPIDKSLCKHCYDSIKEICEWYQMMK